MIWGLAGWFPAAAIGLGDIDFAADDGFYACFLSCHIEIDDAIHGAVVGDRQAVHAQFLGSGNELRYATHAIEEAVFGVDVKVGKFLWHRLNYSIWANSPKRRISDRQKFLCYRGQRPTLLELGPKVRLEALWFCGKLGNWNTPVDTGRSRR
jgi:hypothetical protein